MGLQQITLSPTAQQKATARSHRCTAMEGGDESLRAPLSVIQGVPLVKYFADNWPAVERFQARPDDLIVSTYPKAGTTWVSEIIYLILNNCDTEAAKQEPIYVRVPFLEFAVPGLPTGTELMEKAPSPRFLKTHLPYQLFPETFWENNCKVIYVARNAKDVAVSYYHFYKMAKPHPDPGTWDEFLEKYMAGEVSFGSWYDHVKGWWEKRKDHRILFLLYEDIMEDPKHEILKILRFLEMNLEDEIIDKIVHHTSFKVMKGNIMANYSTIPTNIMDNKVSNFMRKGISGDWKNHFTVAQNERFDEDYELKMAGCTLHFRTEL